MATLAGDKGKLKVGYQIAAHLRGWTVTSQQDTLGPPTVTLIADAFAANAYWITQRPIAVGLWMGKVWWTWHIVGDVVCERGIVKAQLFGDPAAVHDF